MAKAVYLQSGESLDYVNGSEADIEAGDIVALGKSRIGVAATAIPKAQKGSVAVTGIFYLPKNTSTAITAGDAIFYSSSTGLISKDSSGNIPAGVAVYDAAASDSTVAADISAGAAAIAASSAAAAKG